MKVQKFEIASGEAAEAAGAVESLLDLGIGDPRIAQAFLHLIGRTGAMLTGLVKLHRPA